MNRKNILLMLVVVFIMIVISSFNTAFGATVGDWVYTCNHDDFDYSRGRYTPATCVTMAKSVFPCKKKGCNGQCIFYSGHYVEHVFGIKGSKRVKEATCTEDGYTEVECLLCLVFEKRDRVPATGHRIRTVNNPPTCFEEGSFQIVCINKNCPTGIFFEKKIPKLEHIYDPITVDATCTTDGYRCNQCIYCGSDEPGSRQIIKSDGNSGHNYSWLTGKVEPTCQKPGKLIYKCSLCRNATTEIEIENDPTKNHIIPKTRTHYMDPTCENEGYDVFHCTEVGCDYYEIGNIKPPLGLPHNWEKHRETKPTCGSDGELVEKCKKCGDFQHTTLPATGQHKDKKCDVCKAKL